MKMKIEPTVVITMGMEIATLIAIPAIPVANEEFIKNRTGNSTMIVNSNSIWKCNNNSIRNTILNYHGDSSMDSSRYIIGKKVVSW